MENKKFSELVVGDSLFIYDYFKKENFREEKIIYIEKVGSGLHIKTKNFFYIMLYCECNFKITTESGIIVTEAIATSMDRLLLETMEG